jgi:hypothetical protein
LVTRRARPPPASPTGHTVGQTLAPVDLFDVSDVIRLLDYLSHH